MRARPAPAPVQAPEPQEPGVHTVFSHYLELFRLNRRLVLAFVLVCASLACAYALYKLNFSPEYRSSAKVTAQPTDAELRYSQIYVRSSSFDTANVITRSHIEYLKSREIAARAYAILQEGKGALPEPVEPPPLIAKAKATKQWLEDSLLWLNSGNPVEEHADIEDIVKIQDSIELAMVESSFVMEIAVTWNDPQTAADIANILARVHQQRSREQVAAATSELTGFLKSQKSETEQRLNTLLSERNQLRAETGVVDIVAERRDLLTRLFSETEQLDSERRELRAIGAKLQKFHSENQGRRYDGISRDAKDDLSLARFREVELSQSIEDRKVIVTDLETDIRDISALETRFEGLNAEIESARGQLDDIDARLLEVRISRAESIETLRVVDVARPSVFPEKPRVVVDTVLGGTVGFLLAMMLILSRDFVSARPATQADLTEIAGLKVLKPTRLSGAEFRFDKNGDPIPLKARPLTRPDGDMRPFLDWYDLDSDRMVLVLDVTNEYRARVVGKHVMDHYPFSENVSSGLLGLARRAAYLSDCSAVLITLGRGEIETAELREHITRLRDHAPDLPIAATFVEIDGKPRERMG